MSHHVSNDEDDDKDNEEECQDSGQLIAGLTGVIFVTFRMVVFLR
jgi:hypothetical protein